MKLTEVSAKSGYIWFWNGILLFRQNSLVFIMLFLMYLLSIMIISIVPVIGTVLSLFLIPAIRVHFMGACRSVISNKRLIWWTILFNCFRSYSLIFTRRLFVLSIIYTVLMELISVLSNLINNSIVFKMSDAIATKTMLVMMILYTPVSMMFWFAPILTVWHNLHPVKALFFSIVSCWRNRWAFLIYGLLWLGTIIFSSIGLIFILEAIVASTAIISIIIVVFIVFVSAMLHCSSYATYQGCFQQKEMNIADYYQY
ncbi:MAG: BPSS1780 family membrane protein [Burkholderia sp.]|nr:BPSS1780 family membrane protein [Burkholderia sp.]